MPSARHTIARLGRSVLVLLLALVVGSAFAQRTEIEFWHGLGAPSGPLLEQFAAEFNASQDQYTVNASYKGSYPDTMNAAIAAFRAGNAPHVVQMYEVGTGTMIYSGAIKPVHELFAETGVPFDPEVYLGAVRGYYSLPDGRMMSMPFNSSTAVMFVNDDALAAAGLDPATTPLDTWDQVRDVANQVVAAGAAPCGFSFAWPTWTQFEQFSAIHDVPYSTRANGFEGLDAELQINSPLHVRHVQTLIDMAAEGSFTYGGRGSAGDALFPSGECAILQGSSGLRGRVVREATFDWSIRPLPVYADAIESPLNSIIGGASFWVMTAPGRTEAEYRAVAEFFNFLGQVDIVERFHVETGFLPIVFGVYEKLAAEGYYDANPGADTGYLQLARSEPTPNSMGFRLGNMPELRNIIEEEFETALQGQQSAQQALDNAVERGDVVLRAFERTYR
jgi:sn-glycerol 3-phosphate transport system substrate-binding protein